MNLAKLIFGLVALVLAFLTVFVPPIAAIIPHAVGAVAAIAGLVGIKNWRENYGAVKAWMESKTILGALIVVLPVIALVVLPFVGVALPQIVTDTLFWIVAGGGGLVVYGIFDAVKTKPNIPVKAKDGSKYIKPLILLMIGSFLFTDCSFNPIQNELGVENASKFVDVYYTGMEGLEDFLQGSQPDMIHLMNAVFAVYQSVQNIDIVVAEIRDLTDEEILFLVGKGSQYDLGLNEGTYKQYLKLILFGLQTGSGYQFFANKPEIVKENLQKHVTGFIDKKTRLLLN